MLLFECRGLVIDVAVLGQDLKTDVLSILACVVRLQQGYAYLVTDIVEEELGAGRALDVDTASELNLLSLVTLAVLEVRELLLEVADVVGDVVLLSRSVLYLHNHRARQPTL